MIPFRDLARERACLSDETEAAALRVLGSGRLLGGAAAEAFNREIGAELDAHSLVGVASGSDAIAIALKSLGVKPGDEVLLPAFTAPACASAVRSMGATPVAVDVDPASALIDVQQIPSACTPRTKAVLIVHLFGRHADLTELLAVSRELELATVEDCAQAFGLSFDPSEPRGDMSTYSFYPTKNLPADGDAGAVACFSSSHQSRIDRIRTQGRTDPHARIDEIQAAIVRARLSHLSAWSQERRLLARNYDQALAHVLPTLRPFSHNESPHLYAVRSPRRDDLQEHLKARGVASLIHYPKPIAAGPAPVAARLCEEVLSLPLFPSMRADEQRTVIEAVMDFHRE